METLSTRVHDRLASAFDLLEPGADPVLRASDRADFQVNGVMALAKRLGRNPRDVATQIVHAAELDDLVSEVDIAGPGFINLTIADSALIAQLVAMGDDESLGVPAVPAERVVVDYSAPNVAKEMHVGHLRSTVIGDSLCRLLRFVGHTVIRRNHVGDWGTPFGMLIEHLVDLGEDQAISSLSVGDLNTFYAQARSAFESDDTFKERSRQRVVMLQSGDLETLRLWRILVAESVRYFAVVYESLGVELTEADVVGESYYNPMLESVVTDLDAQGLLVESNGAACVFPPGFTNREGEPLPLIVRKSDEGFGYAATDLAAIRDRTDTLGATKLYYVVGAPQSQHLEMVFAVAKMAGWLTEETEAVHVAFGNVLGADRKMFKSRSGETVKLVDLLDEGVERAREALASRSESTDVDHVARQVAMGAIKFADLSTDRHRDYIFDWDRMLAFEGATGPYLQYAHARIRSIFRRAGQAPSSGAIELTEPAERDLARHLVAFPDAIDAALEALSPAKLCQYLFDLAQRFTTFYENCPVLNAPSDAITASRLELCELSASTLRTGLGLLGIEAPEHM